VGMAGAGKSEACAYLAQKGFRNTCGSGQRTSAPAFRQVQYPQAFRFWQGFQGLIQEFLLQAVIFAHTA